MQLRNWHPKYGPGDPNTIQTITVTTAGSAAQVGDLAVAIIGQDSYGDDNQMSLPAGWTSLGVENSALDNICYRACYKIVTSPGPQPVTCSWVSSCCFVAEAAIVVFSAADSVSPNIATNAITAVQFYNGATLLGEDTSAPYNWTWSDVSAGSYSLSARVVYDAGSTLDSSAATVSVTSPLPSIALTAPVTGVSFTAPATVDLAASVTANGNTITMVQFYNGTTLLGEDTSAPYSVAWNSVVAGSYSLTARAVYGAGSTVASSPANVTVANLAPTIALTAPITGASFTAPATINFTASVTADGNTITKVQFYNGATLLGEDTSAPYAFTWSNASAGSYSLSARVVYDAGSTVTSPPANIAVPDLGLPAPWQTADLGSVSVVGSASISNGNYTQGRRI